jgi:hypothetical protein
LAALSALSNIDARNAEVFYWKGICQLRLAANREGSYKEAGDAFQRYLALAPHGRFAAEVDAMLKALPSVEAAGTPTR